jgi:hypothetical protein
MEPLKPSISKRINRAVQRLPRLTDWLIITLVLLAAVWVLAPHQLPVSLYKLSLVSLAGVAGYWIDRSMFPYARPDVFLVLEPFEDWPGARSSDADMMELAAVPDQALLSLMGISMLRRAIIVGCAMLAMGLGA